MSVDQQSLFRPEVMQARADSWLGPMRIMPPPLARSALIASFAVLTVAALIVVFGSYTRHETIEGEIGSTSGVIGVTATSPGEVAKLSVVEGQVVAVGDVLFELHNEASSPSAGAANAERIAGLQHRQRSMQQDIDAMATEQMLRKRQLQDLIRSKNIQRQSIAEQIAIQVQRTNAAESLYQQWVRLSATGIVSKSQLTQQHDIVLQAKSTGLDLIRQQSTIAEEIEAAQSQMDGLDDEVAVRRRKAERDLQQVAIDLSDAQVALDSQVRAPVAGRVTTVLVHNGERLTQNQAALVILPSGKSLVAEIWAPTSAIGFITPGDPVRLKYQAYPYRVFGFSTGRVSEVSEVAMSPEALAHLLGRPVTDPRYRVRVVLDRQSVLALGRSRPLKPGMQLEAEVVLGKRRLLDWIFDPLGDKRFSGVSSQRAAPGS